MSDAGKMGMCVSKQKEKHLQEPSQVDPQRGIEMSITKLQCSEDVLEEDITNLKEKKSKER